MRVTGGYLRGKKILDPLDKSTRPLKDIVKESIFNIVKHSKKEFVTSQIRDKIYRAAVGHHNYDLRANEIFEKYAARVWVPSTEDT